MVATADGRAVARLARVRPTPEGLRRKRWTHRELAEQVGMSESQAEATLRAAEIKPHLLEQWVMSDLGPDFDPRPPSVRALPRSARGGPGRLARREDGHPGEHRPGWICNRDATDRFGASTSTNATGTQNLFAALRATTSSGSLPPRAEQH